MEQVELVLSIVLMFVVRLGIPVLVLILIGTLIDRIQSRREKQLPHIPHKPSFPR
jgi:hypothetical protein